MKTKSFNSTIFCVSLTCICTILFSGCDEKLVSAVTIDCPGIHCPTPDDPSIPDIPDSYPQNPSVPPVTQEPQDPQKPQDPQNPQDPQGPQDPQDPQNPPEPPTPPTPCAEGEQRCANGSNGLGWTMVCQNGQWIKKASCDNASCHNDQCGECMNRTTACENNVFQYCQDGAWQHVTCESGCSDNGCLTCRNGDIYCQNNATGIGELHICSDNKWMIQKCDGVCDETGKACTTAPTIEPIILEPCDKPDDVRCRNDVWLGYIDRCIDGYWVQESSCGNASCMDDKTCGECMVSSKQKCKDGILTVCNSGKLTHIDCGYPYCRLKDEYWGYRSEGDECGMCGYGDSICAEYLPGYGIMYFCDAGYYFGGISCLGPCNEASTGCAQPPYQNSDCTKEGESYCIDNNDDYYFSESSTFKCTNGKWEQIRCPRGCNDKHTECKAVDNIDQLKCPSGHISGDYTCYMENGKYYEKHCENSFWTAPIECPYGCNEDNTACKSVQKCDVEGATKCTNIGNYGRMYTCSNGIWTNERSCGYVSCQDDHCGTCANHTSGCLDSINFGYCHNGTTHEVACRSCDVACYRCQNEGESYCWDYEPGKGEFLTCVNGFWKTEKCKFKNSSIDAPCRADGMACQE